MILTVDTLIDFRYKSKPWVEMCNWKLGFRVQGTGYFSICRFGKSVEEPYNFIVFKMASKKK